MQSTDNKFTVIDYTNNPVIKTMLVNYLKFGGYQFSIDTRQILDVKQEMPENALLVFDFEGFNFFEMRDAICDLRLHKSFMIKPILIQCTIKDPNELRLLDDLEFVWHFGAEDLGGVIVKIFAEFSQKREFITTYGQLKSKSEFALGSNEFLECLEGIKAAHKPGEGSYKLDLLEAKTYFKMRDYKNAMISAKKASTLNPQSLTPNLIMASICLQIGKKEEIARIMRQTNNSTIVKYILKYFEEQAAAAKEDGADKVVKKGAGIPLREGQYILSLMLGSSLPADAKWQQQEMAKFLNMQAIACNTAENFKEAERYFKAALHFLKEKEVAHKIWYNLALCRYRQRDFKGALSYCQKGTESTHVEQPTIKGLIEKINAALGRK